MTKTILIVDDEMLIAMDIGGVVEELGYVPLYVSREEEAERAMEGAEIVCAIVDWHLQHHTAENLVLKLRAKAIPVLICSGSSTEEIIASFPSVPYVLKPFQQKDIKEAITVLIRR